jgi:hypothetical protein
MKNTFILSIALMLGLSLSCVTRAEDSESLAVLVPKTIELFQKSDPGLKKFIDSSEG